nr:hypothetical protein [Tanacetum cinerariifolium]GEY21567.1 hypothetical protein [Tanacetum cinerariifolium]GEY22480.1 hypothetical protein [Tanacetum cinerariifolium]
MRRVSKGYSGVDVPLFPTMLVQGLILQSDPTISPPPISSPLRVPTLPHDSPLPGDNTPGNEEGRMTLNELTILCTSLSKKVESLESDLMQIKLTYGTAYSKLIMKVMKLENKVKSCKARRRVILIVSEDEDDLEDPSKQGKKIAHIDEDEGITLVQIVTTVGVEISTASPEDKTIETFDDSNDITLAETLIEIRKSATELQKVKGVGFKDVEETPRLIRSTITLQPLPSIDPKDKESFKKQKLEEDNDAEKEELRAILDIVPKDDIAIDVESLATKYTIVDWKTYILTENMMYYQIIRSDGSSKNYKIFSKMLDDFDRQDVIDLHRLVPERYDTTSPEGYDLLLWRDLKILFKPNEEDEIWKNQQDYTLIS